MAYGRGSINADFVNENEKLVLFLILKGDLKWWDNHRKTLDIELYEK